MARLAPEKVDFRPALPSCFKSGITEMRMATKPTYREQLLHPNWQRRRLEMLSKHDYTCESCGDKESTLHVHHKRYVKGRLAWEYVDDELSVLCASCHTDQHAYKDLLDRILYEAESFNGGTAIQQAVGLLGGFFASQMCISPEAEQEALVCDGASHDLGILAGMAACADWPQLATAADNVRGMQLSPAEEQAMNRWKGN